LSIQSNLGLIVDINKIPNTCKRLDHVLFSETQNRFIISTQFPGKIRNFLSGKKIPFANIGVVTDEKNCILKSNEKTIFSVPISELIEKYDNSISGILEKNPRQIS